MKTDVLPAFLYVAGASALVAFAAAMATDSNASCDDQADDDNMANICQAYGVGSAVTMIGAATMLLAAFMSANQKASSGLFLLGLAMLSGGLGCIASANAQNACDTQTGDDDTVYCNSNSIASIAYFISAAAHFIGAILAASGKDDQGSYFFLIGMSLYAGGYCSLSSGQADSTCKQSSIFLDDDFYKHLCDGYTTSSVLLALAMGAAGLFVMVLLSSKDDTKIGRRWIGWFLFFAVLCGGFAAQYSGLSDGYAVLAEQFDDDGNVETFQRYSDGFAAAAAFAGLAAIISVIAIIMAASDVSKAKNLMFLVSLGLFSISGAAFYGTLADNSCDNADENNVDDDTIQTFCDGYSAATAFFVFGGAIFGVGGIASLFAEDTA